MAKVDCTKCGKENIVDDMTIIMVTTDIKVKCRHCGRTFIIPGRR